MAAVEAGESEKLKAYLAMMGRSHRYSLGNQLLIRFQRPGGSAQASEHEQARTLDDRISRVIRAPCRGTA